MSRPLDAPEYLKIYMLLKQTSNGLFFYPSGVSAPMGSGFYSHREDAEKARTVEILSNTTDDRFHVFELEIPNPSFNK